MDIAWQGKRRDFYFAKPNLNRATIKYAAGMIKVGMKLPDMTFEELYYFMNDLSVKKDFLT